MEFSSDVFYIKTDITVPRSEIIFIDVFKNLSSSDEFISYRVSPVFYHKIARSFITSINIKIEASNNITYKHRHPIILQLHFRKNSFI